MGDGKNVSHNGNVQERVALEDEGSGGMVVDGCVGSAPKGVHGCGNGFVDECSSVSGCLGWMKMNDSAKNLSDGAMCSLDDGVGGRRVRRDVDSLDAGVFERELEGVSIELGSVVMNDAERSGVAGEPMVLEKFLGVFGGLGLGEADDLDQIGDGIDAGESVEAEGNLVDLDCPWADEINVNFGPGDHWSVAGCKRAMGVDSCADRWADLTRGDDGTDSVTDLGVVEVATDHGFKLVHAG